MLEALNAIVDFINMIVSKVADFLMFTAAMNAFIWKAVQICINVLLYIPEPFLHFAVLGLTVSVVLLILRVIK